MLNSDHEDDAHPILVPGAERKPLIGSPRFLVAQETWIALGIVLLTLAAYLQVMGFAFVDFDDPLYITRNVTIQSGLNWKSFLYAFTTGDDGSYLPLVWLSHAACVSLFGTWAGGHHLVSLLLHVVNSVLLFCFLNRLTKSLWPSAAVAFLFALHPLHVESVAWISERKDVLSTLFWILTSWAYVRYVERPSVRRYLGMVLLFILGLLSKSMLVTLPLTLLLIDVWPLRRIGWTGATMPVLARAFWPLITEKIPLFMLSMGTAAATILIQRDIGAVVTLGSLPLHYRLGNALIATTTYLLQTFWPVNLSAFYPYIWSSFPVGRVIGSFAFVLSISLLCLLSLRRRPYLAVGWFWYLITLLPVVGIIQVGSQSHADRYTYVPLIGIFMMLSWLAEELVAYWGIPRRLMLMFAASLLGVMLTLTVAQAVVWRDTLTLFKNAYSLDRENPVALLSIGDEYLKRDQTENAHVAYLKALQFSPGLYLSHLKLGHSLELLGRNSEALPNYMNAYRLKPDLLGVKQKIGSLLTKLGRYDEAEPFVKMVIQGSGSNWRMSDPVDLQASHLDWAAILISRDHRSEAALVLEEVVAKNPKSVRARVALGLTLRQMDRLEDAHRQMEQALELSPRNPAVLYHIGLVLIRLNRFTEARDSFNRLKSVDPQSPLFEEGNNELEKAEVKANQGLPKGESNAKAT